MPLEVLKTSSFALGFQLFPWDLANVNDWKIMFDASADSSKVMILHADWLIKTTWQC